MSHAVHNRSFLVALIAAFTAVSCSKPAGWQESIETRVPQIMAGIIVESADNSKAAFKLFSDKVRTEIKHDGNWKIYDLAWLTRTFCREYYQKDIVKVTSDLIRFKTFATDVPNRQNPEFIKQKAYIRQLAEKLGLNFRDVGGFVYEIWIGESEQSFGLMVHSDVQPVDTTNWHVDPWSGEIKDGRLWGRGAIDDKGPLAAIMYAMRTLVDSGMQLDRKIILLVGTDEESANEDVTTYLKSNPAPDQTIVVDANYPVVCAEKGWCGTWMKLPHDKPDLSRPGLHLIELNGGFSVSAVPGIATAKLLPVGTPINTEKSRLQSALAKFHQSNKNADIALSTDTDTLVLTALGQQVHSSVPHSGHNALMDLIMFLEGSVKPVSNNIQLMAGFAAEYIGFELDGNSLGIKHHDEFMGDVTVAANIFQTQADSILLMFNYRLPRGITAQKANLEVVNRIHAFAETNNLDFSAKHILYDAHYISPDNPFVLSLMSIYNDLTGESRRAESMGGGTYARRLPNAVVFGPETSWDEYTGHQPNENIRLSTLEANIEILTHTITHFAMELIRSPNTSNHKL